MRAFLEKREPNFRQQPADDVALGADLPAAGHLARGPRADPAGGREDLGYTDAWSAEVDSNDAFTPLAAFATWAPNTRLGCAIASVYTRTPTLLAQTAAAIEELAPGRFCLGIGTSSPAIVERWNGVPLSEPMKRMRDTIAS